MTQTTTDEIIGGLRVGPFELLEPLGWGGMGEVWRARHVGQCGEVAVKIIGSRWAADGDYHEAFAREVRAVASLSHPGVVEVHDYGVWEGGEAPRSYLVMEYAPRGSLQGLVEGPMSWGLVRELLLQVCRALAHAHARGIIHRDLKPGNVLLAGHERPRIKLTDFGVAHALSGHVGVEEPLGRGALAEDDEVIDAWAANAGTPAYMPPEQIMGRWRDFGPWTDLYALGCMAWELLCGRPPYEAAAVVKLASLHLYEPLPRLSPRVEVPRAMERWLRRLLRKRHWERFPSAADAAWALRQIPAPAAPEWAHIEGEHEAAHVQSAQTAPAWGGEPTRVVRHEPATALGAAVTLTQPERQEAAPSWSTPLAQTTQLPTLRPPWPSDWRAPERTSHRVMAGAGLGLYGLRELPLVGRRAERDALWAALGRARRGAAEAVVVRGASGVGKSRLVEWLAVRAQEVGAAEALRASHNPTGGPGEGVMRMIAHHTRCMGLERQKRRDRLEQLLGRLTPQETGEAIAQQAAALAQVLAPRGADLVARVEERSRWAIARGYLARLSRRRPLVVWVDDAQWGASSIGFVEDALARAPDLPVLFVLTVREDLLAERPVEARRLRALRARAQVSSLRVEPLDESSHRKLVEALLGLEGELAQRVSERTLGNPLFAVQLVGDWVERGVLRLKGQGFVLEEGATAALPDDLHSLWRQRIGRLLAERFGGESAAEARVALELGATLGLEVDEQEWEAACMIALGAPPPLLEEVLLEQRLARPAPGGWAFVHGMLRESLLRVAQEAARGAGHHEVCVQALRLLYGEHAMGHADRVARHLLAAGRSRDALDPLIDATYHYQVSGQYAQADQALGSYEEVLEHLEVSPEALEPARAEIQRVWLDWSQAGVTEAQRQRVAHLAERARQRGWPEVLGECWRWRGLVARFEEGWAESLAHLGRARGHYEQIGDEEGQARCALSMAVALRGAGELERAEACLIEAVELASRRDFFVLLPRCFGNLAEVSLQRGRLEEAGTRFERARRVAEDVGDRKALAFAIAGQGELALARGQLEEAARRWARAEAIFGSIGSSYARSVRVQQAAARALAERPELAGELVAAAREAGPLRDPVIAGLSHLVCALVAAHQGRWQRWRREIDEALEVLARTDEPRPVLVHTAERCVELGRRAARQIPAGLEALIPRTHQSQ